MRPNQQKFKGREEQIFTTIERLSSQHPVDSALKPTPIAPNKGRRPGRPSKPPEEKVRLVSMKLSPQIITEIKNLPFGRGVGSKVRELLSYFKRQEYKEIKRAGLLRKLLIPFDAHLHSYLKLARQNPYDQRALTLLEELLQMAEKIKTIVELFHWDGRDFRTYLQENEALTLQFALDFTQKSWENPHHEGLIAR